MKTAKWNMYIKYLQGHPSRCDSSNTHNIKSMKFITEFIPPNEFPRMLNIGVGEGLESKILHDLGYNVTGIINGETNVDYAKMNFPDIKFIETDMHDLPFKSESFDSIYTNHVFEHSYAPYIFLLEMYSVLRPKGKVWIAMPDFKEIDDPTIGEPNRISHHHPNMLCYNLLNQMFESAGFKMIYCKHVDNNSYFDNPYLLEKMDMSHLHTDVATAIKKRKEIFG